MLKQHWCLTCNKPFDCMNAWESRDEIQDHIEKHKKKKQYCEIAYGYSEEEPHHFHFNRQREDGGFKCTQ